MTLTPEQLEERSKDRLVVVVDASLLKESACLLRAFYTAVMGYRGKVNNNDIEFGTAIHKFKATWRESGDNGYAPGMLEARKHFRDTPMKTKSNKLYMTDTYVMTVCAEYADRYKNDNFETVRMPDGGALIELKFAPEHLIYSEDEFDIVLAGTIDEIGKFKQGIFCIADLKTTTARDIQDYFRGYKLSAQLKFYRWIFREYAREYPDSIFEEISRGTLGCFIDGVFLRGKDKPCEFARSEIFNWDDKDLDEVGILVNQNIDRLKGAIKHWKRTGELPLRGGMINGACHTPFGHCKFFDACAAVDPTHRAHVIAYNFITKHYNPLLFGT